MLLALIGLVAVMYLGYQLVTLIKASHSAIEALSLSYLLGMGIFTFALFLANVAGVPYAVLPASLILVGLIALATGAKYLRARKTNSQSITHWPSFTFIRRFKKFSTVEKAVLLMVLFILGWAFVLSSFWPVSDWDAIVLYDFRAKTFVETGYMQAGLEIGYFLGYPLLTSLGHAWLYMLGYKYPGLIHSLFYLSFVGIFYYLIRKKMPRLSALIWTLIFSLSASLFDHAMMTYTNLAYTVYLVTGYFYLFEWVKNRQRSALVLSALLVALSTWTRSAEPFWLVMIGLTYLVAISRRQWSALVIYPLLISLFRYPWQLFEKWHVRGPGKLVEGAPQVVAGFMDRFTLATIPQVIMYFWLNVLLPNIVIYVLFALTVLLMLLRFVWQRRIDEDDVLLFVVIAGNLALTLAGIYYFSLYYEDWVNIGGSALRMSLFFGPLIIYFIAQVTSKTPFKITPK